MAKHSFHILELAKKGALHRYQELKAELAALVKAFPHLELGSAVSPSMPRQVYKARRKRKPMAAAAKAAVSKRMKAYWAARRKAKKG